MFDRQGVIRFGAWRGLSEKYRMAVEGHSPWSPDAKDPEPILVPDVALDPELAALRPVFDAERIATLAFVPLVHTGRLLGKFMLYYDTPHPFAEEEVRPRGGISPRGHRALGPVPTLGRPAGERSGSHRSHRVHRIARGA